MFDSSGSLAGTVGSERKIDIAKRAVARYLRIASMGASVGLLVYGHKGNNTEARARAGDTRRYRPLTVCQVG